MSIAAPVSYSNSVAGTFRRIRAAIEYIFSAICDRYDFIPEMTAETLITLLVTLLAPFILADPASFVWLPASLGTTGRGL